MTLFEPRARFDLNNVFFSQKDEGGASPLDAVASVFETLLTPAETMRLSLHLSLRPGERDLLHIDFMDPQKARAVWLCAACDGPPDEEIDAIFGPLAVAIYDCVAVRQIIIETACEFRGSALPDFTAENIQRARDALATTGLRSLVVSEGWIQHLCVSAPEMLSDLIELDRCSGTTGVTGPDDEL